MMKIISYETRGGPQGGLHFEKIYFTQINLIVGDSASGKTRLLNTIFNSGLLVIKKDQFFIGGWDVTLEHQDQIYRWNIDTYTDEGGEGRVLSEIIAKVNGNGQEELLVERTVDKFIFAGKELPRLSQKQSSISLLQDEDLIKPLYLGFASIIRRNFSGPDLEFAASFEQVPQKFINKIDKERNLDDLFPSGLNLNARLYVLSRYFKPIYDRICKDFKNIFPFVTDCDVLDAERFGLQFPGIVPVFAMKEKHIKNWIPLNELSAGMRKVLLIITDIFTMPKEGGIYLIDEYESSLGINAINIFPSILYEADLKSQFIITSHHPYIISNVPVRNWIILHRKGEEVLVKQGGELEERFGKSKQQAFIQLISDPFYTEGVE